MSLRRIPNNIMFLTHEIELLLSNIACDPKHIPGVTALQQPAWSLLYSASNLTRNQYSFKIIDSCSQTFT